MNKLGMLFSGVLAIAIFAFAGLELAEPASAPDIEALRNQAFQAVRAEASSRPVTVDAADASSESTMVAGNLLLHFAYQARNARGGLALEMADIEVLRHNFYTYLKAAKSDSAEIKLDGTPPTSEGRQ